MKSPKKYLLTYHCNMLHDFCLSFFQLATQIPGPLVGSTVVKSQPQPPPCLELVPLSPVKPVADDVSLTIPYSNCRDVVCIPSKDPEGKILVCCIYCILRILISEGM